MKDKIFFAEFLPEKHNPQGKEVDAHFHAGVLPDIFPGRLHAFGPVNVIEHENRMILDIDKHSSK